MTKAIADKLLNFKQDVIKKVFGKKRIKTYPEKFLPTEVRRKLHSMQHFNEAERKINPVRKGV
jgi:hypothetical protein